MTLNFLLLNSDKTEVVIFVVIKQRTSVLFLTKICHLDLTLKKSVGFPFFTLGILQTLESILSSSDAEKLVHAFVTSRLDYCNSLLSGSPQNTIKSLQLVQNAAARILMNIKRRDHISPVLASLHWLPVRSRIEFKILLLTYKALKNLAPSYI